MGKKNDPNHVNKVMDEQVSESKKVPAKEEAEALLSVTRNQIFIEDDTFIPNPFDALGQVIEIRKSDGECPTDFIGADQHPQFSIIPLQGFDLSEKLTQPVKRKSILVDKSLSAKISFLNYLQTELDFNSVFNVMVFDQAAGRINQRLPTWNTAISNWKEENKALMEDESICYLLAVTGVIQKNVIRKKYRKFEGKAKGGGWGLNLEGKLHTSNEDYSLDFRFGLSVAVLKRPAAKYRNGDNLIAEMSPLEFENEVFSGIAKINRR
ncbi:MAG: hypothetical protein AAF717_20365 [Bacteroidota bacterium]